MIEEGEEEGRKKKRKLSGLGHDQSKEPRNEKYGRKKAAAFYYKNMLVQDVVNTYFIL